jgi:acyl-CoA synthetase (AMP-forming)/AMP-acid ligase II/acyl carrier protein
MVELLRVRAKDQADRQAYSFLDDGETEGHSYTYADLDLHARAIAAWLQDAGTAGKPVLLAYPPGLEFVAAFFACLYAGAAAVPVYPPRPNRSLTRLQAILADTQASAVLTTASTLADVKQRPSGSFPSSCDRWVVTNDIDHELAAAWQEPQLAPETLALIQYSSGSTGTPKGIMITHGNLLENQRMIQHALGHTDSTRATGWLPHYHDMGLIGNVVQPAYVGFPIVLMPPAAFLQKPVRWLKAISRYRATTSIGPNFAYDLCVRSITPDQRNELDLSSWEVACNGAEPVRAETLERFAATFAPCGFRRETFYPCYGMAESTLIVSGGTKSATPVITAVDPTALERGRLVPSQTNSDGARHLVGCGRALPGERIVVVHPQRCRRCEEGEVGEIWVSGRHVAQGYWNRPAETETVFGAYLDTDEGPFLRTGDLGCFWKDELYVTGRLKDLIIVRGCNHYPQDIELTVEQSHPALRANSGAAFSIEVDGQEQLVLVQEVMRTSLRNLYVDAIVEAISEAVSEEHDLQVHGVTLVKTGSIPKTTSGKIQRRACRDGYLEGTLKAVGTWCRGADKRTLERPSDQRGPDTPAEIPPLPRTPKAIEAWLSARVADRLRLAAEEIDVDKRLARYGLDSIAAVQLTELLQEHMGRPLPVTLALDYPTIKLLAQHLSEQMRG